MGNVREQKGLLIAQQENTIKETNEGWIVQSTSKKSIKYKIKQLGNRKLCNCKYFTKNNIKCKHIYAVEYKFNPELKPEIKNIKKTYSQDWVAYDKAKTQESKLFKLILLELLETYFKHEPTKGKRTPNKERVMMMALKVYYNIDFRKCQGLIEEFVNKKVSYKSLSNFFEDESLSKILDDLILITALPLAAMETT